MPASVRASSYPTPTMPSALWTTRAVSAGSLRSWFSWATRHRTGPIQLRTGRLLRMPEASWISAPSSAYSMIAW